MCGVFPAFTMTKPTKTAALAILHARCRNPVPCEDELEGLLADVLYDWHVVRCFEPADEFVLSYEYWLEQLKPIFMDGHYTNVFGFLQWVLRHEAKPYGLDTGVDEALRESRAAYALFDNDTIIPIGSDAERETLARTFADVAASEFRGARSHLRNAGSELTASNYPASIRESIQAVESVARVSEPSAKALAPAPSKLEKSAYVHGALGAGFRSLYGSGDRERDCR